MYKRILMPIDGSKTSEQAIHEGLELAKALGAQVTFLYAVEDPVATVYAMPEAVPYQPQLFQDLRKAAEDTLQHAKSLAEAVGVSSTTLLVERKHPVDAIREVEADTDLIIMGTHGRRGFNRMVFGSVAEGVLRRASTPCLLIRHEKEGS